MREYIFPIKIKDTHLAQGCQGLLRKKSLQIGLEETDLTVIEDGGYIILDYGKEMNGSVRILTYSWDKVRVRIRFGESLKECCSELGGEKNATNDHSMRDFSVSLCGLSDMTFGNTGFRFVRLDFCGRAEIKSVVAVNNILKKKALYSYEGDDKLIKEIYTAAKRTIDLCAGQDYLWDGVKRDRLVWIGDAHPEMLALTLLYGKSKILERSLDFVKEQTPIGKWMNNIPMYSMWWIIILADYCRITNSYDYLKGQTDYLEALVKQISQCVSDNGEFEYPFYFVDWPTKDRIDEKSGVRAINIIAMKKAIEILEWLNKDTAVAKRTLESLLKKKITVTESKQVAGLKFFATGLEKEDKELLVKGGAMGMSTFMSYYILKAVASFDKKAAVEMMKEYYGKMLEKGATTFFEDFSIEWAENSCSIDTLPKENQKDIHGDFGAFCYKGFRHSLCHGWSAGVLQFIKEEC